MTPYSTTTDALRVMFVGDDVNHRISTLMLRRVTLHVRRRRLQTLHLCAKASIAIHATFVKDDLNMLNFGDDYKCLSPTAPALTCVDATHFATTIYCCERRTLNASAIVFDDVNSPLQSPTQSELRASRSLHTKINAYTLAGDDFNHLRYALTHPERSAPTPSRMTIFLCRTP